MQGLRQTPAPAAGGPSRRGGSGMQAVPGLLALLRGLGARHHQADASHLPSQGSAVPGSLPRAGICTALTRSLLPRHSGKRDSGEGAAARQPRGGGPGGWLPRLDSSPPPDSLQRPAPTLVSWQPARTRARRQHVHVSPCWVYPVSFLLGVGPPGAGTGHHQALGGHPTMAEWPRPVTATKISVLPALF